MTTRCFGLGLALWRLRRFPEAADYLAMAAVMRPDRPEYGRALRQVRATLARTSGGRSRPRRAARRVGVVSLEPARSPSRRPPAPCSMRYDALLLDLDGVVYVGADAGAARRRGLLAAAEAGVPAPPT